MKMRIGTRLMVWAALVVFAVVVTVSYATYRIARAGLRRQISSQLRSIAQSRAAHVQTFLDAHRDMGCLAATAGVLPRGLRSLETGDRGRASVVQELNVRLERFLDPEGEIYGLFLLNRHGEVAASTSPEEIGLDMSTEACFVGARDGPFIRDAHRSSATGRACLEMSAPIFNRQAGELLGVLVGRFNMDRLHTILADRTGLGKTGETYLINKYGFMITPSRFMDDTFLKLKVDTETLRHCLADIEAMRRGELPQKHEHGVAVCPDYRGVSVLAVHDHIPEMQWCLLAEIDVKEAFAPIARLGYTIAVFAWALATTVLALAYFFARRISRPIHNLHVGSERIGRGELGYRVDIHTGDEIEQLADEFNRMAARLSESYASLERRVVQRTKELVNANEALTAEIVERRRAEAALRESETKHRTLVENLPQKIFVKNRNSVYISCNDNYGGDLKINADEISGKTDYDFYPRELAEKYRADDRRIMDSGATEDIEEPYVQDGKQAWVHTVKTPLRGENGEVIGILGIFWDITERKRAERQLQDYAERLESLNAELERSNRDLQDFTHTVSHDLQEPLRKIHTFGQFLMEDCMELLPEESRAHLRRIQDAALRMKARIQHLLTLARVGPGGGEMVPVEPRNVIDEVLDDLSEQVRGCGAEVSVEENLPTVEADPVQLGVVFQNLVGNALKFRSPDRAAMVSVSARVEGNAAVFSISDNGIGIEEPFVERIFGIFQRLHPAEQYEGDGVGLALCKKIVQRHEGRIWVESETGEGSTFHFTLRTVFAAREQEP